MGVLVDVIRVISTTEKEGTTKASVAHCQALAGIMPGLTVAYLASELRDKMDDLNYNPAAKL